MIDRGAPAHGDWVFRSTARTWRCLPAPSGPVAFHRSLPGYEPTPLTDVAALAGELGVGRVLVKDESDRLGLGSFKVLGASWALARIIRRRTDLQPPITLRSLRAAVRRDPFVAVTATEGNHGHAVAHVARLLGIEARIFVPVHVHDHVAARIRSLGAIVERVDGDYDRAVRTAAGFAGRRTDVELVQDMAWAGHEQVPGWIVEGYSTMLVEVEHQLAATGPAALVVVPVGVGSLAQAVTMHHRGHSTGTSTALLGVEPTAAACVLESRRVDERRTITTDETVMVGLNCGTPSAIAWPFLRHGMDAVVVVDDAATSSAVDRLAGLGISSGPSGAASLAGAQAVLTGLESGRRRLELGIGQDSVVVLLSAVMAPA